MDSLAERPEVVAAVTKRSDTSHAKPTLLTLPFEIRHQIWKLCQLDPIALETVTVYVGNGSGRHEVREIGNASTTINLPLSPLLLVNHHVYDEARTTLKQQVTLSCTPGYREALLNMSSKRRNFITELSFCVRLWNGSLEEYIEIYEKELQRDLDTVWRKVAVGKHRRRSSSMYPNLTVVKWEAKVENANALPKHDQVDFQRAKPLWLQRRTRVLTKGLQGD